MRHAPDTRRAARTGRPVLRRLLVGVLLLAGLLMGAAAEESPADRAPGGPVFLTDVAGAIGPATTRQIGDLIATAEAEGGELAIIRIDTPGGLSTATRDINKAILASRVPVAVFVAPQGARAASAGTYILYASHLAAMARSTNLGAATPVQMGGGAPGMPGGGEPPNPAEDAPAESDAPGEGGESDRNAEESADGSAEADAPGSNQDRLAAKAVNDAVAQIRGLAELRGRNADWAERAVREGASLSAGAALEAGVIEIVADDVAALLEAADGREIEIGGETRRLAPDGAAVVELEPSIVTKILAILSNPNVALLLMTLGFYGLLFELSQPGLGPGIPGAICLLLGLYALNLLPVDYTGLALIGLGLALMAAEAVTPTFGVLGVGGAASFAIGGVILVDTDVPDYQVSTGLVIGLAAASLAFVVLVIGAVLGTRGRRPSTGASAMIGHAARVEDWDGNRGHVFLLGERWSARGPAGLSPGTTVEIRAVEGLVLEVAASPDPAPKHQR